MSEIDILDEGETSKTTLLFGKYELGKLLGTGSSAKVYYARDHRTGQSVAIKIINKKKHLENPNNPETPKQIAERIKREVSIMKRLSHPNIIKLYEVMATKTEIYFVMELAKGGELFDKVSKHQRLSEDLSRVYFHQLVAAVGYCHVRGVFHRDLKPENMLLDEHGNLKVTDFGLSALTEQIHADGLLHTMCGTRPYVAPDILWEKGYDGAKVDVWSCGVVLYVLAVGNLPFKDANIMRLYDKIKKGVYSLPKFVSPDMKRFISRLLDTNPETRITMDEILDDPWFVKGGLKPIKFHEEFDDGTKVGGPLRSLNAFDLISFSAGLDLSGLFASSSNSALESERFISEKSPEKLVEEMEGFAKEENIKVKKVEEFGFEMEGQNGKFLIGLYISLLNDVLVVVEVKRRGGDVDCYKEMWNNKLKLQLIRVCDQDHYEYV